MYEHNKAKDGDATRGSSSGGVDGAASSSSTPRGTPAEGFSLEAYVDAGGGGGGDGIGVRGAGFRSVVYRRGLAAEPPETKARYNSCIDSTRYSITLYTTCISA